MGRAQNPYAQTPPLPVSNREAAILRRDRSARAQCTLICSAWYHKRIAMSLAVHWQMQGKRGHDPQNGKILTDFLLKNTVFIALELAPKQSSCVCPCGCVYLYSIHDNLGCSKIFCIFFHVSFLFQERLNYARIRRVNIFT